MRRLRDMLGLCMDWKLNEGKMLGDVSYLNLKKEKIIISKKNFI